MTTTNEERRFDREVEREPGVHGWCVCLWLYAVEDFLVEFGCEVAGKAMDLSLLLLASEREIGKLA